MIYLLVNRYIITDLNTELHITDLKTGDSWKRIKIAADHNLLKRSKKII